MSRGKRWAIDVSSALPGTNRSGSWDPDETERAAAWEMLVELSTRISVVELADDEGLAREALDSLHGLFHTTRGILRSHGPDVARNSGTGNLSFGVIAVRVLNDVLRPMLSKWHLRLEAYENLRPDSVSVFEWERRWEDHQELRDDLRRARQLIRPYVLVLAEAADVHELAIAVLVPNGGQSHSDEEPGWRDHGRARTAALGFRPQHRMVRWLSPAVLVDTAWKIVRLSRGGSEARTLMNPPDGPTLDCSQATGDFWFDYVADLGDAFDPTMAVAWHLGRDTLSKTEFASGDRVEDLPPGGLPRGRFLVMGGDEVYPFGTRDHYANQTTGPYALALPKDRRGTVLALPGNHDWYDGLDAFKTVFLEHGSFGGWQTVQDASWFGIRLPKGWWLWALDTGLHGDLNISQRTYFARLAEQMEPGDHLIIASPVPFWRLREKRADGAADDELDQIKTFLEEVVPGGVMTPLALAGDTHVYAHYVQSPAPDEPEMHHVTSGGGGAFLHPTHNLAPTVPQSTTERDSFQLLNHWPPRPVSRHALAGTTRGLVFDRQILPLTGVLAVVHLVFAALAGRTPRAWIRAHPTDAILDSIGSITAHLARSTWGWIGLAAVLLVCTYVVPRPNVAESLVQRAAHRFGFLHGLVQATVFFLAAALGAIAIRFLSGPDGPNGVDPLLGLLLGAVVGGLASTLAFAHYLRLVNQRYRIHDNEAFSGRHIRGYKHFLRCRIDEAGDLRLHVVGLENVRPGWAGALADGDPPPTTPLSLVDVIDIPAGGRTR